MKYKAEYRPKNGTWFVRTMRNGRGYRFDTEQEAKEQALIKSMQYYTRQVDAAYKALKKQTDTPCYEDVTLTGTSHTVDKNDLIRYC